MTAQETALSMHETRILPRLIARIRRFFRLIALWRGRIRQRRALARLDAHLLQDIGVGAEAAQREADKPFWRK